MPLDGFFLDYRKTALAPDEIIESVAFPMDWRTAWHKLGKRGAMNISLVTRAGFVASFTQEHLRPLAFDNSVITPPMPSALRPV